MPRETTFIATPEQLLSIAARLADCGMMIHAVADKMKANSLKDVTATHANSLAIGMKNIEAFASSIRYCVYDALDARVGLVNGSSPKDSSPPAAKKKTKK